MSHNVFNNLWQDKAILDFSTNGPDTAEGVRSLVGC